MRVERLALEVEAKRLGWLVLDPPVLVGRSGVEHTFSFLASTGSLKRGIDIFVDTDEIDVLKAYVKKYDTGATVDILCTTGKASEAAKVLAKEYGMKIITVEGIKDFFSSSVLAHPNGVSLRD